MRPQLTFNQCWILLLTRRRKNKEDFGKKVSQYKLDGNLVATTPTMSNAAKLSGIGHSDILKVIQKKRASAGGYYWQEGEDTAHIDLNGYEYGEKLRTKTEGVQLNNTLRMKRRFRNSIV